jgi:hypothetical protein
MDDQGVVGVSKGQRDPLSLEILNSSSSDENKALLKSNLYMGAHKTGTSYCIPRFDTQNSLYFDENRRLTLSASIQTYHRLPC